MKKNYVTSSGGSINKVNKKELDDKKDKSKKEQEEHEREKKEQQKMEEEEAKKRDASWKAMKYSFLAFGSTFGLMGTYMIYQLGNDFCFEVMLPNRNKIDICDFFRESKKR